MSSPFSCKRRSRIVDNRRTGCAGFFIILIIGFTASGCASTAGKVEEDAWKPCRASSGPTVSNVLDAVSDALARGKWQYGYNLENGNPLLIRVDRVLFLIGNISPTAAKTYFRLFSVTGSSSNCVFSSNGSGIEYLVIDRPKNTTLMPDDRNYLFLYPGDSARKYVTELEQLSKVIGKTLVLQFPDSSPKNLLEMRKTIVHEGAHLFGQEIIASVEPLPPDTRQTGRAYIEQLVQTNQDFRESVQNEFCHARKLFAEVNAARDIDRDEDIKGILLQMLDESETRGDLFDVYDLESFWYVLEGVPQYLEQLIDKETDPRVLEQRYDQLCASASDAEFSLYFVYLGAAFLHGVDLVSSEKSSELEFFYFDPNNVLNFRERVRDFVIEQ